MLFFVKSGAMQRSENNLFTGHDCHRGKVPCTFSRPALAESPFIEIDSPLRRTRAPSDFPTSRQLTCWHLPVAAPLSTMADPSPAETEESTEQRPAESCRTIQVTVTTRYPALFSIRYRDQRELYEKFKRKLKKLGIRRDQLYWMDYMGDRQWVDGLDDFAFCLRLMNNVFHSGQVTLYAAAPREELETSGGHRPKQRKSRRRSPSLASSVSFPDRHHSSHLAASTYCCCCYPPYPFYESRDSPTDPCLSCRSCCGCHGYRRHSCHFQ